MGSRFLAAAIIAAVVVGLASDAGAQQRSRVRRTLRKAKVAPAAQGPASSQKEAATTTQDQGTATSRDPSKAAAGPSEKTAGQAGESTGKVDSPGATTETPKGQTEKATFGAGCFWHVEAAFEWLPGVKSAVSGYSGGSVPHPSYEEVHEGFTGHAEVVQVVYDPAAITYEQLLKVFWSHHDPTQLNRQGPDVGTQYRSVIFYHNEAQRKAALKSYQDLTAAKVFRGPIVTQLVPMRAFYRAEDYHQNYYGGKEEPRRVARSSRSRRTHKPAARTKASAAVPPKAAQPAARSSTRPGGGGAAEP